MKKQMPKNKIFFLFILYFLFLIAIQNSKKKQRTKKITIQLMVTK